MLTRRQALIGAVATGTAAGLTSPLTAIASPGPRPRPPPVRLRRRRSRRSRRPAN